MSITNEQNCCRFCGSSMQGAEIPVSSRHNYNHGPNGEFLRTAEDYAAIADQLENPTTHFSRVIGIEYSYDHPGHYDGVSEWQCPDCGTRVGRWSGDVLEGSQYEARYGGES